MPPFRRAVSAAAVLVALVASTAGCEPASNATPTSAPLAPDAAAGSPVGGPSSSGPVDESFRPTGPTVRAKVVRIVDGDTIVVRIGGQDERLRYIGMDTPETVKPASPVEWMGPEASRTNAALVEGRTVELEKDVSETDQYGRLLRYVWLVDGDRWTLVNLELVRRGFAQVETDPPDVRYADRFVAAERAARDAGVGLWGPAPSGS
jgi:micrococcal nuclease